ncbi:hypothetical protein I6F18_32660 [Bradyrhizobium sp. NBAIM32]|nr:hypothetical protein [Bradyrhizobium sp. NBAIM32]
MHDAGVPVLVSAPERYAVHKLIIATKRNVVLCGEVKKRHQPSWHAHSSIQCRQT